MVGEVARLTAGCSRSHRFHRLGASAIGSPKHHPVHAACAVWPMVSTDRSLNGLQAIDSPEPTNQNGSQASNKNCLGGWLYPPRPEVFNMPRRGVKVSLRRPATLTPLPGHAAGEAGRRRRDGLLTSDSGMEVQLPVRQTWLDKRNPHRSS